jgi:hypothetical protein
MRERASNFLMQINAGENPVGGNFLGGGSDDLRQSVHGRAAQNGPMWQPITTAPFDCDLELAVIDADGPHALVFPCRRILGGWVKAETRSRIDVHPTHWRLWDAPMEKTA